MPVNTAVGAVVRSLDKAAPLGVLRLRVRAFIVLGCLCRVFLSAREASLWEGTDTGNRMQSSKNWFLHNTLSKYSMTAMQWPEREKMAMLEAIFVRL